MTCPLRSKCPFSRFCDGDPNSCRLYGLCAYEERPEECLTCYGLIGSLNPKCEEYFRR